MLIRFINLSQSYPDVKIPDKLRDPPRGNSTQTTTKSTLKINTQAQPGVLKSEEQNAMKNVH